MLLPSSEISLAGSPGLARFIFQGFSSRFHERVQEAVAALRSLPQETAEWIALSALRHPSRRIRRNAATALAYIKSESCMILLLDLLRDDRTLYFSTQQALLTNSSRQVALKTAEYSRALLGRNRKLFAMLLGELDPDFSFPILLDAVTSTHRTLRAGALNAFRYGHPGLRNERSRLALMQSLRERLRPGPIAALGYMKAVEVIGVARQVFEVRRTSEDLRLAAARALAEVGGDEASRVLLTPLGAPAHGKVGDAVAEALRRMRSASVVHELLAALGSTHPAVRLRAATALEYSQAAAGPFRSLVRRDPDVHVRRAVARILGELRDSTAWSVLLEVMLTDRDRHTRWNAAWALGRLGHGEAVAPLVRSLGSLDPRVRHLAAEALGAYGLSLIEFPQAMESLAWTAGDFFPFVARSAAWALRQVDLAVGLRLVAGLRRSAKALERARAKRADYWLQPRFASYAAHFPIKSSRSSGVWI